jgi:tRNA dimethylallyltransferase
VAAGRIDPANGRRLVRALEVTLGSGRPFSTFGPGLERYPSTPVVMVGMSVEPAELDRRIADRFGRMMDAGLLDEVAGLATGPGGLSATARQALGYRELLDHLEKGVPLGRAVEEAVRRTRSFARRQMAWFRRDPRIRWMDATSDPVEALGQVVGLHRRRPVSVGSWASTP